MKLCFIADGRSAIARNWISFFGVRGHEVDLISTHPCERGGLPGVRFHFVPWIFDGISSNVKRVETSRLSKGLWIDSSSVVGRMLFKVWESAVQPTKCFVVSSRVAAILKDLRPDLVHALRIPIEGEVFSLTGYEPGILSIWGNDLTLYAGKSLVHRYLTKRAFRSVAGVIADCQIDLIRAKTFGLDRELPTAQLPGGGGINKDVFFSAPAFPKLLSGKQRPVIINPRGFRRYVRNDIFFRALELVFQRRPNITVVAVGLKGWKPAEQWVQANGLRESVILTGSLSQTEMAELYRASMISVSPAEHDGTPNTLLESMACGCLPISGDLPSIREWITPGENGLLFSSSDSAALAEAILTGLDSERLRSNAQLINRRIIQERADYETCMSAAEKFYEVVLAAHRNRATSRDEHPKPVCAA